MAETVRYFLDLQGTDDAAEGLKRVGRQAQDTERDLDTLGDGAKRSSVDMRELEDSAGETDSVLKGLAGAIGIVSPELEGLASAAGDAAGGFEAVLRGGPKLAGVLGIITAALTAAAFAWKVYNDELEAAEQKQSDAAERALEVAEAQAKLQDFLADVELRRAVAAGEVDESALITSAATQQAEAAFMERRLQIEGDINREMEARRDLQNAINEAAKSGDTEATVILEAQRAALDVRLNGARDQLAGLERQAVSAAVAIAETMATGAAPAAAGGSTGGGTVDAPAAPSALNTGFRSGTLGGLYLNQYSIGGAGAIQGTSITGGLDALSPDLDFGDFGAGDRAGAALARFRAENADNLQAGAGALGGLATGNVNPLLSLIPGGGLLGGIANVGNLGAGGVGDMLDTFTEAVRGGLKALPEILSEVLPDFAVSLVTELIPALIAAAPEIFASLITGIASILSFGGDGDPTSTKSRIGAFVNLATGESDPFGGDAAAQQDLATAAGAVYGARSSSSITRPRAPIPGGAGGSEVRVILGGDIGALIDRFDIERGPNGTRPGTS